MVLNTSRNLPLCTGGRSDSETAGGGSVQEDQVGTGGVRYHCLREWSGPPINSHIVMSKLGECKCGGVMTSQVLRQGTNVRCWPPAHHHHSYHV